MTNRLPLPEGFASDFLKLRFGPTFVIERWVQHSTGLDKRGLRAAGSLAFAYALENLSIEVEIDPALPFAGWLRLNPNGFYTASIGAHLGPQQRDFTICHEIGHAALNRLLPDLVHGPVYIEELCDQFAIEMLGISAEPLTN